MLFPQKIQTSIFRHEVRCVRVWRGRKFVYWKGVVWPNE